jgi:uncharacterized protein (PEP-CTERM system associated)
VYNVKTEPISAAGNPLPPALFATNDNTQTGGSVQWTNRITQALNLLVNLSAYRTVANSGPNQKSNQGSAVATLSYPFSARTVGFVGARYQGLWSEFATEYNETAAFAGISYTFR